LVRGGDEVAPGQHKLRIGSRVRNVVIPLEDPEFKREFEKTQQGITVRAAPLPLHCLSELRWVERFTFRNLGQGGVEPVQDRVLQQAWQDESTGAIVWKDVPVEKES
jgi:hypothetical protein